MDNEQEIDLHQIINILIKRKLLIIAITLTATIITFLSSYLLIDPAYEAVTRIVIVKENAKIFYEDNYTANDITMYQKLVKTYIEIAKSDKVTDKTAESFKQFTTGTVKNSLNAVSKTDTQIIELKVRNEKPDMAADIANVYAKNFIEECKNILPAGELAILDEAKVPNSPVSPKKELYTAAAFCISLMASIGIAFLLEYMDTKIRSEEQIETYIGLQILGIIS